MVKVIRKGYVILTFLSYVFLAPLAIEDATRPYPDGTPNTTPSAAIWIIGTIIAICMLFTFVTTLRVFWGDKKSDQRIRTSLEEASEDDPLPYLGSRIAVFEYSQKVSSD